MNNRYDELVTDLHVICNACALARTGLIIFNTEHLDLFSKYPEINKLSASVVTYYHNPCIDYEYEVNPSQSNEFLLLPTKERALVECIKFLDNIDEGLLIEGLKSYLDFFWDDRIYEVAEHFGVTKEVLDYWLNEAREDCEV